MTSYEVQYELPVNNPGMNVGKCVLKSRTIFLVPINHPDAHNMGYQDLLAATELSGRLVLYTALNNKRASSTRKTQYADVNKLDLPEERAKSRP